LKDLVVLETTLHRIIVASLWVQVVRSSEESCCLSIAGRNCSDTIGREGVNHSFQLCAQFLGLTRSGLMALPERMNPFHSSLEPPDEGAPLPLLSASLSA